MKNFLKNNWYVLLLFVACVAVAVHFILSYGKIPVHLYLNQFVGNRLVDNFFYYITYLGDGAVMPFILLLILLYNARLGIYSAASFFTATIITSVLKYQFYDDVDRPRQVFKWTMNIPLNYVDESDLYIHNSFPSGHATQAFAIFMCLVFFCKRPEYKLMFFTLALATAFSRVYLSQHWLVDITAGSIIGTLSSIGFYLLFFQKDKFKRLDTPLLKLKRS